MFKILIIEMAIEKLKDFLNKPNNSRIKEFLLKEKTQSTLAEIYSKYADFVEEQEQD